MKILIVGGTSTMAEHCARLWLKQANCEMILLGRDENRLQRVTQDLQIRNPNAKIHYRTVDFLNPIAIQTCINTISQEGNIDIALIAHGTLPDQEACQNDLTQCQQAIEINAISPVLFAEAIANEMLSKNHGKLAVIGSVAGDRGRKSNYIYGASKALIDRYMQGLQHRIGLSGSNVTATLIKPGPTQTPMTAGISGKGKMATPEQVAKDIVDGIHANKRVIYTPGKWAIIMMIIRHLPFFVFKKMDI